MTDSMLNRSPSSVSPETVSLHKVYVENETFKYSRVPLMGTVQHQTKSFELFQLTAIRSAATLEDVASSNNIATFLADTLVISSI